MDTQKIYHEMGISSAVLAFCCSAEEELKPRFAAIDAIAEYNQAKVVAAMQKNRVSAECFAASTGYGYNDIGREALEKVYADTFHTEAALVRPQITCGTHALAVALSANLLPGDELLAISGKPYDTLEEVIGIRPSPCSLAEATGRSICSTTAALIFPPSAPPSRRKRSSSTSSAPRATSRVRRSRSRRSARPSLSAARSSPM